MATYKLIQDIEAEDHILGPLTLRQFIYGLVAALFFYLSYIVTIKHVVFLLIIFLPPALLATFLAFPFGKDQPTEIWALAKIRFLFKPRKRIWDQSGIKQMVTVTAPKKIEEHFTNGLSQGEVKSRLRALADTLDTRGWAIKHVGANDASQFIVPENSQRLVDIHAIPQPVPDYGITPRDDMLDEYQNPENQQLNTMIDAYDTKRRQKLYDILNNRGVVDSKDQPPSQPASTKSQSDLDIDQQLKIASQAGSLVNARMHSLQVHDAPKPIHVANDPVILNLSRDNNLSVSTISSEANKAKEIVIDLHK
jgi:hypothetical protein